MTTQAPQVALYEEVADRFRDIDSASDGLDLLAFLDEHLSALLSRDANPHDAETCRLAMLAAAHAHDPDLARVWRARALARFAACEWAEGVGAIVMSEAFIALARANNDYPHGKTFDVLKPSEQAIAILDEAARFSVPPGSGVEPVGPQAPTPALVARFVHEKQGFLHTVAGDFQAARASYNMAMDVARDSARGRIKVALGIAVVDYLEAESPDARSRATAATQARRDDANAAGYADLVQPATHNIAAMTAGREDLLPYEIL